MKLSTHCPTCQKILKLKSEFAIGETKLVEYECGHIFNRDLTKVDSAKLSFDAVDGSGKSAREYQKGGVQFILESDFNAIIADQMRLGKTPQALLALKNAPDRLPCLILVKSANLWQWIREYKTWVSTLPNGIYPIVGGDAWIPPGFDAYICSMDTFSLKGKCKCGHRFHDDVCTYKNGSPCACRVYQASKPSVSDKLKALPFKLVICDEAHSFKNTDSNRSQTLVDFITYLNTGEETNVITFTCARCDTEWQEKGKRSFDKRVGTSVISKSSRCPKCAQYYYVNQQHSDRDRKVIKNPKVEERLDHLLALASDKSTTDAERALASERVKELVAKESELVENKPCGLILLTGTPILNRAEEYFVPLNLIAPETFPSLASFQRNWLDSDSKGRYTRVKSWRLDAFKDLIKDKVLRREKEDVYQDMPAINRMYTIIEPDKETWAKQYNKILDRLDSHLAEKANPTYWDMAEDLMELRRICGMMKIMWTSDYVESFALEGSAKIALGIHHETVREVLYAKLGTSNCYKLSGADSAEQKDRIMREWETSSRQFLIINMLAGGVGMDFHYCDNVLVLERGWNSAMEEQFEFRFYNPDRGIKKNALSVEYILAKGTIDEWWHDMVEAKRRAVGELVANHWDLQTDAASFKELCERTVAGRL